MNTGIHKSAMWVHMTDKILGGKMLSGLSIKFFLEKHQCGSCYNVCACEELCLHGSLVSQCRVHEYQLEIAKDKATM